MCNLSEGVLERGIEQGIKRGIEQGIERGIERGIEQNTVKTLINAYNLKMNIQTMQGLTGLSEDKIRSILKSRGYDI